MVVLCETQNKRKRKREHETRRSVRVYKVLPRRFQNLSLKYKLTSTNFKFQPSSWIFWKYEFSQKESLGFNSKSHVGAEKPQNPGFDCFFIIENYWKSRKSAKICKFQKNHMQIPANPGFLPPLKWCPELNPNLFGMGSHKGVFLCAAVTSWITPSSAMSETLKK